MMRKQFSLLLAFALVALTASVSAAPTALEDFSGYEGGTAGAGVLGSFSGTGAVYFAVTESYDASTTACLEYSVPGGYIFEQGGALLASDDYVYAFAVKVNSWATTPTASMNITLPTPLQDDGSFIRGSFALNFYGANGDLWLDQVDASGYTGGVVLANAGTDWAADGLWHHILVRKDSSTVGNNAIYVWVDPASEGSFPDFEESGFSNHLSYTAPYGFGLGWWEYNNADSTGAVLTYENLGVFNTGSYATVRDALADVFATYAGLTADYSGVDSWQQFTH
ncbi:hypothetical protein KQI84_05915 [bacterium]|nr:hypothetical protein [bacterium]